MTQFCTTYIGETVKVQRKSKKPQFSSVLDGIPLLAGPLERDSTVSISYIVQLHNG